MMLDLRSYGLVYIASPYSRYADGLESAFIEICRITARLIDRGVKAYSPIAHTHPIAIHGNIDPLDHAFWMDFDKAMMTVCNACLVVEMSGWRDSVGITHEIARFLAANKPVLYLDPKSMMVRK